MRNPLKQDHFLWINCCDLIATGRMLGLWKIIVFKIRPKMPFFFSVFSGGGSTRGAKVNRKNGDGMTPLHLAAQRDRVNVVKYLLANGADVNVARRSLPVAM